MGTWEMTSDRRMLCRLPVIGRMSQSTKRKHVTKEVLDEFRLPENNEKIVQVLAGRGNNLHEVYDPSLQSEKGIDSEIEANTKKYLVSMPTKFRKNVWIKRGDFVVVEPIAEGDKVKAEIVQILYKEQIKYIKDEGQWPSQFSEDKDNQTNSSVNQKKEEAARRVNDYEPNSDEESDDESDIFQNTNRPKVNMNEESTESSSSEDEQ